MKAWSRICALTTTTMLVFLGTGGPAHGKTPGPNGRIAFARFDHTLGDTVTYTANPDGSHQQQLYFGGPSGGPHWSPDGSQVSIGTPCTDSTETCAATIVDPDSGAFRQFKWPDPTLETDCIRWSPDGQRLSCLSFGVTDPSRNGIYTIRSSDGGGLTRITSNPGGEDDPATSHPTGSASSSSARTNAAPSASSWSGSTGAGCDRSRRRTSSQRAIRAQAGRRAGTRSCLQPASIRATVSRSGSSAPTGAIRTS